MRTPGLPPSIALTLLQAHLARGVRDDDGGESARGAERGGTVSGRGAYSIFGGTR